ncbi:MAG TPA: hypothetical protein VFL41_10910 [Gaiellaceae bacterium]|nr:hypothetical protein [Gaiellaceae bacterium]
MSARGIAISASGKLSSTSARPKPPARPLSLTWYSRLGDTRAYVTIVATSVVPNSRPTATSMFLPGGWWPFTGNVRSLL